MCVCVYVYKANLHHLLPVTMSDILAAFIHQTGMPNTNKKKIDKQIERISITAIHVWTSIECDSTLQFIQSIVLMNKVKRRESKRWPNVIVLACHSKIPNSRFHFYVISNPHFCSSQCIRSQFRTKCPDQIKKVLLFNFVSICTVKNRNCSTILNFFLASKKKNIRWWLSLT